MPSCCAESVSRGGGDCQLVPQHSNPGRCVGCRVASTSALRRTETQSRVAGLYLLLACFPSSCFPACRVLVAVSSTVSVALESLRVADHIMKSSISSSCVQDSNRESPPQFPVAVKFIMSSWFPHYQVQSHWPPPPDGRFPGLFLHHNLRPTPDCDLPIRMLHVASVSFSSETLDDVYPNIRVDDV